MKMGASVDNQLPTLICLGSFDIHQKNSGSAIVSTSNVVRKNFLARS